MAQIGKTFVLPAIAIAIAGAVLLTPVSGIAQEDGPDHPPMLGLMPPPGTEKPEGVEMSDDPAEMMGQMVDVFFGMMDVDGSGALSLDELQAWVVHPPMEGEHMGGEGMEGEHMEGGGKGGDMAEQIRHLEEELRRIHDEQMMRHMEEMHHHQAMLAERLMHVQEELDRLRDEKMHVEEEARQVAEEIANMAEQHEGGGGSEGDHEGTP